MAGTVPFEFTKNYKFTMLNNENVWAKADEPRRQREGAGRQGHRRDDRPHQGGRELNGSGLRGERGQSMSAVIAAASPVPRAPRGRAAGRSGGRSWSSPTCWSSWSSCSTRSATASGWPAIRRATSSCSTTRSSSASVVQHGRLPRRRDQRQDGDRAVPVGLLRPARAGGSRSLSLLFILPWAVPSIPTILSVRFMLNPEWGVINSPSST